MIVGFIRNAFTLPNIVAGIVLHAAGKVIFPDRDRKPITRREGARRRSEPANGRFDRSDRPDRRRPSSVGSPIPGLSTLDVEEVTIITHDPTGAPVRVFRIDARASIWKSLRAQRAIPAPDAGDVEDVVGLSPDLRGAPIPLEETAEAWARDGNRARAILAPIYLPFDTNRRRFLRSVPVHRVSEYASASDGIYAILCLPGGARELGAEVDRGTEVVVNGGGSGGADAGAGVNARDANAGANANAITSSAELAPASATLVEEGNQAAADTITSE